MSDHLQAFEIGAIIVPVKRQQSPAQIANLRKFEKVRSGNPKGGRAARETSRPKNSST
jgi:hypothetical protein